MGRRPVRGWMKGAMTAAERQARRRQRLRHDAEIDGLVDHVDRVMKQATATEKTMLLRDLGKVLKRYQHDMDALAAHWKRRPRS